MPRSIPPGFEPGDVLPDGSIVLGRTSCIEQGIIYVTRRQAKDAVRHGWFIMDKAENDEGIIRVSRRHGRHHSFPFGKSDAGYQRRQARKIKRRERMGTLDARIIDEDD